MKRNPNDFRSGTANLYGARSRKRRRKEDVWSQEVKLGEYLIAPEGWEWLVYSLYVLCIPYMAGLAVLFVFVAKSEFEGFLVFDFSRVFVIWAIGYEVVASLILSYIFYYVYRSYRRSPI